MDTYQTKSAVLFVIFNRPDTTKKVFEQIRLAQPPRLYIVADGPRSTNTTDVDLCAKTRNEVTLIDWPCDVKKLCRDKNAGCRNGVSAGIDWFFDQEEEGIILEDDCLPHNSFFKFCDELLARYRTDTRVRHITGCNLQEGKIWGNASYYFSRRTHVWGWASWRRAWKDYDLNLTHYTPSQVAIQLANIFEKPAVVRHWMRIFMGLKAGEINSWAYPLDFINFFNNGLIAIPNQNLVSNIGFGKNATNTLLSDGLYANVPLTSLKQITHPVFMLPEKEADYFIMDRDIAIDQNNRKPRAIFRRIQWWLNKTLNE